jgi:hypothetical protein
MFRSARKLLTINSVAAVLYNKQMSPIYLTSSEQQPHDRITVRDGKIKCKNDRGYSCNIKYFELTKIGDQSKEFTTCRRVIIPHRSIFGSIDEKNKNELPGEKIIVSEEVNVGDLECWSDPTMIIRILNNCGEWKSWTWIIKYIKIFTYEVCTELVKKHPPALQNINFDKLTNEQIFNVCMSAIKIDGSLYEFCPLDKLKDTQISQIQITALQSCPRLIGTIKNLTHDTYRTIIKKHPGAIIELKNPSYELECLALENDGSLITEIKEVDYHKFTLAIKNKPYMLMYFKNYRETIINELKKQKLSNERIDEKIQLLYETALKLNGTVLIYVPGEEQTEKLCIIALKQTVNAASYVNNKLIFKSKILQQFFETGSWSS